MPQIPPFLDVATTKGDTSKSSELEQAQATRYQMLLHGPSYFSVHPPYKRKRCWAKPYQRVCMPEHD
eukprot:scaffold3269_cov112-Skeletonema_dohrnii-CCMP3373.AAC.10